MAQVLFDSGVFKGTIKHPWLKREGGVILPPPSHGHIINGLLAALVLCGLVIRTDTGKGDN